MEWKKGEEGKKREEREKENSTWGEEEGLNVTFFNGKSTSLPPIVRPN